MDSADLAFVLPTMFNNSPLPRRRLYVHGVSVDRHAISVRGSISVNHAFIVSDAEPDMPGEPILRSEKFENEDKEFIKEKLFFETLTQADLKKFIGQHVAVHGQQIVDSDPDLYTLTNRFFSANPNGTVYITFVGNKPRHFIPVPIL